ncbi:MAG: rhamnulose-1-phosphate aldolase [Clostridiales bacterium]|jgi:rhamnulose-1-phosphate aldolase|nr:rhamnulose-1-phosphate aldolase [Clostridiales bacterium]
MDILKEDFMQGFIDIATEGYKKGWHERNGGNLSYRIKPEEAERIKGCFSYDRPFQEIGRAVPNIGGEYFLVTGSGKYFRNIEKNPSENLAVIEIDEAGEKYRVVWGLSKGGRPTSELPTHLMNHSVKKELTQGRHRIIYHSHPANIIALTFVLPLEDAAFSREIWEMITECPIVFPEGIGVVPWMVPGGCEIAEVTAKLMEKYNVVLWAHHGIFCSEEDFDSAFGLIETVEKAAEILVKVLSMSDGKRQTITAQDIRNVAVAYYVKINEDLLK